MSTSESFNQAGIGWSLQTKTETGPYSKVEAMPDSVMTEMLKQLRQRRLRDEQRSRDVTLRTFKEARPHIQQRLASLTKRKTMIPIDNYISELASLATDLWDLGSRRSGWMALSGEFERAYASLSVAKRVEVGTRLLRMLMDDDEPELARGWAGRFDVDVNGMEDGDPRKACGLEAIAEWYLQMCGYEEAVTAFGGASGFKNPPRRLPRRNPERVETATRPVRGGPLLLCSAGVASEAVTPP